MSNIDKQELREAAERAESDSWGYDRDEFNEALTPSTVLALLDELEAAEKLNAELMEKQRLIDICQGQGLEHRIAAEKRAEAAEKRIAELEAREINLPPYSFFDFKQGSPFKSGAYCHIDSVNQELSKHGIKMTAAAGKGE
ncbi:ead/Ea22-like family protein [Enterobacter asburiae]|uniref:ead/Ea22-like family protein n=1 Tax=Enterobacter asburiae TaxID=61645 RepID=UPI002543023A|nr:ead/Ea22-like family protein [Enterobacter asburiae]WIK22308.1 ead/Ea22-like family protein [Enterobacter asburiae]